MKKILVHKFRFIRIQCLYGKCSLVKLAMKTNFNMLLSNRFVIRTLETLVIAKKFCISCLNPEDCVLVMGRL